MKLLITVFFLVLLASCAPKLKLENLNSKSCSDLQYGRVELKRVITDQEKSDLNKSGMYIHEFVFENLYLASWNIKKWQNKNLDKTPIKSLKKAEITDKLAGGITLSDLQQLAQKPGKSMVLIQTLSTVDIEELKKLGKLLYNKDMFYRLEVTNAKLEEVLNYPCLRLMSIFENKFETDKKEE